MSKSAGNVVDPMELADTFGVDQLRYFLLREVSFGQDGSYSEEAIITRCNADLANSFGNLVQRVMGFIFKNLGGVLPSVDLTAIRQDPDNEFLGLLELKLGQAAIEFELLWLDRATQEWIGAVYAANAYVDEQAPWALRKINPDRMRTVLAYLVVAIKNLAVAIQPVTPSAATAILDLIGVPEIARRYGDWMDASWYSDLTDSGHTIAPPKPIFPRLEMIDAGD
jgi:methionyl-tRNA synthetase